MENKNKNGIGHNSNIVEDASVHGALTTIFDDTKLSLRKAEKITLRILDMFKEYASGLKDLTPRQRDYNRNVELQNRSRPLSQKQLKPIKKEKLSAEEKYELRKEIDQELHNVWELIQDADATSRVYEDADNFNEWIDSERGKNDKNN